MSWARAAMAAVVALTGAVAGGCQMGGPVAVQRTEFRSFEDAWRVTGETLEFVVIPEGGRVMVLRRVEGTAVGENLLWVNPELSGPTSGDGGAFFWANYGGDKTWPWSQADWEKVFGVAGWPPPREFDARRFRITPMARGVRLEGPVAVGQRMRLVREVTLVGENRVRVLSRIEAVGMGHEHAVAAWTVTQMPWPDEVWVEGVREWGAMAPERKPWAEARVEGGVLVLPGSAGGSAKVGADGAALVYRRGEVTLRQRVVSANAGRLEPMEQLQVFRTERTGGAGDYIELEVTGPRVSVRPGRPAELVVEWEVGGLR